MSKPNRSNPAAIGAVYSSVELVGRLGQGKFSTVYAGICRVSRQPRAVKVANGSASDLRRFEAEYRILAHCKSPYVARVYGYGDQPRPHIVMKLVEGETLRQYMNRKRGLSAAECLRIGADICFGLEALHAIGVIHRDLNLANIIRAPNGHITILDLGMAKRLPSFRGVVGSLTHPDLRVVTSDMKIGTPGFVAPEAHATEKSDVYGLGGVLYALHTRKEFGGDLSTLADLESEDFADLLGELLAPDPANRHSLEDAADHIDSLEEVWSGNVVDADDEADPVTAPRDTEPTQDWLRWLDLGLLALTAFALGLVLFDLGTEQSGAEQKQNTVVVVREPAQPVNAVREVGNVESTAADVGPPSPTAMTKPAPDNKPQKKRRRARKQRSQPEQDFRAKLRERIKTCIGRQPVKYAVDNGAIDLEFSTDVTRLGEACVRNGLEPFGTFSGELAARGFSRRNASLADFAEVGPSESSSSTTTAAIHETQPRQNLRRDAPREKNHGLLGR